jgi:hypothetical protein
VSSTCTAYTTYSSMTNNFTADNNVIQYNYFVFESCFHEHIVCHHYRHTVVKRLKEGGSGYERLTNPDLLIDLGDQTVPVIKYAR